MMEFKISETQFFKKYYLIYIFFIILATVIIYFQFYNKKLYQGEIFISKEVGIDSIEAQSNIILYEYLSYLSKHIAEISRRDAFKKKILKLFDGAIGEAGVFNYIKETINNGNVYDSFARQKDVKHINDVDISFNKKDITPLTYEINERSMKITFKSNSEEDIKEYLDYLYIYTDYIISTHIEKFMNLLFNELKITLGDKLLFSPGGKFNMHGDMIQKIDQQILFISNNLKMVDKGNLSKPIIVLMTSSEIGSDLANVFNRLYEQRDNLSMVDYFSVYRNYFDYLYPSLYLIGKENLKEFRKFLINYEEYFSQTNLSQDEDLIDSSIAVSIRNNLKSNIFNFFKMQASYDKVNMNLLDFFRIVVIYIFHIFIAFALSIVLNIRKK